MTTLQLLGAALLALPFVVFAVFSVRMIGAAWTAVVFLSTAGVVATVCLGTWLLTGAS